VATFETYHPIAPLLNSISDLIPHPFKICDKTLFSVLSKFLSGSCCDRTQKLAIFIL